MDEEKKESTPNDLESKLKELIADTPRERNFKTSFVLRIIGFALIVVAFVLVMLSRQGTINSPTLNKISFIVAAIGFLVYMGSRFYEIAGNIRAKRKK
ncbi:MAG: hypothetical protein JNL74_19550 [Fibrobacteres bacterium]|nr:hypothetical protein [Fibrobacterota bacterium]